MGSMYVAEVTIISARELYNVNWPNGNLKAYAVAWVDPAVMFPTTADVDGHTNPYWNDTLAIPLPRYLPLDSAVLSIHVVHAGDRDKLPVGFAHLHLREVVAVVGIDRWITRTLNLNPQGRLEVNVRVSVRWTPSYVHHWPPAVSYGHPFAAQGHYRPPAVSYGHPSAAHGHDFPPAVSYAAPPLAGYGYGYGYGYGQRPSAVSSFGGWVINAVGRVASELLADTMMQIYDDDN